MTTIHQEPRAPARNVTSFSKSATGAFGILILLLSGALVIPAPSQAGTFANLLVEARGYGGAASTNQTSQSLSNLPVEISDGRSWSGRYAHRWTESSCMLWTRAKVGVLRIHADSLAEAEITGISGSLLAQARAVSYVSWDDSFTVNAGSSLSNQLGEFIATIWIDGALFHNSDRSDSGLYFGCPVL